MTMTIGESDYQRILGELRTIEQAIEELTSLLSHWNGTLRLETREGERGSKSFTCAITLRPNLVANPLRWRVLIHELFHACSAGFQMADFLACRGWEEGVVEQLSRLYRDAILERVGVENDPTVFEALDRSHPFNGYIDALESIRVAFGDSEKEFYLNLLKTPIRERYANLTQSALALEVRQRRRVITVLSAARPSLEAVIR